MTADTASGWAGLAAELDAWGAAGREAAVWWRDDDAVSDSPALRRLLDLSAAAAAPLALAVIPAAAEASLRRRLEDHPAPTTVLQHGFAHANHAARGAKKCELVDPAARPAVVEELRQGQEKLARLLGDRVFPVLVPPWNRIAGALLPGLPGLGFAGLSTYRARPGSEAAPGLPQVNCHVDILQWRPERRFLGLDAALTLLCGHLRAKRLGSADPAEASGLLSHHQVHDDDAWDFLAGLLDRLARHPAVRLLGAREAFAAAGSAGRSAAVAP